MPPRLCDVTQGRHCQPRRAVANETRAYDQNHALQRVATSTVPAAWEPQGRTGPWVERTWPAKGRAAPTAPRSQTGRCEGPCISPSTGTDSRLDAIDAQLSTVQVRVELGLLASLAVGRHGENAVGLGLMALEWKSRADAYVALSGGLGGCDALAQHQTVQMSALCRDMWQLHGSPAPSCAWRPKAGARGQASTHPIDLASFESTPAPPSQTGGGAVTT